MLQFLYELSPLTCEGGGVARVERHVIVAASSAGGYVDANQADAWRVRPRALQRKERFGCCVGSRCQFLNTLRQKGVSKCMRRSPAWKAQDGPVEYFDATSGVIAPSASTARMAPPAATAMAAGKLGVWGFEFGCWRETCWGSACVSGAGEEEEGCEIEGWDEAAARGHINLRRVTRECACSTGSRHQAL